MPRPTHHTKPPPTSPQPPLSTPHQHTQPSASQPALSLRSNAALNLSVLQQHYPSTSQILTLAPFSVLYTFSSTTQSWEKCEVEGTLFVCALTASPEHEERYSVVILNRKGLDNFYLELGARDRVEVELTEEFTILQAGDKVWGLWDYEEERGDRGGGSTAAVIAECAERVGRGNGAEADGDGQTHKETVDGQEPQLPTLNHGSGHHQQQPLSSLPSPTPAPRAHVSPPNHTPRISPPDGPIETRPQAQTQSSRLPMFTPSADTEFFLSRGPNGSQQLTRNRSSASAQTAEQQKKDVLGDLFAKAKSEYMGKGKL